MKQYHAIKSQHPNVLLLFQVGDFYELFFDDAKTAAACLGITLTQRGTNNGEPIPLCGVPVHAIDTYCAKLIKAGFRVALCDQLTEAQPGKVVERGVTQVLTPGTLTNEALLDGKKASYLVVIAYHAHTIGLCAMELLTGQVWYTTIASQDLFVLESELTRFAPDEIIVQDTFAATLEPIGTHHGYYIVHEAIMPTSHDALSLWLVERDIVAALDPAALKACALWHQYMQRNNDRALQECREIIRYTAQDFLVIDAVTQRNLELVINAHDGTSTGTLFSVLDNACTTMGSRVIKKWIVRPLHDKNAIEERLHIVAFLKENIVIREMLERLLKAIGDIERVVGRIALGKAQIVDYQKTLFFLEKLPELHQISMPLHGVYAHAFAPEILHTVYKLLSSALNNDETKPWRIKSGYSTELDRLRTLVETGSQAVIAFEKNEQQRTGISSLKVRYNRAHGYGIEITNANAHLVPPHYTRLQTLTNRERYTTQELRDLEYDLNRAQSSLEGIESELFAAVCAQVEQYVPLLRKKVQYLANLDAYTAFARIAYERQYVRPVFHETRDIIIIDGRHPVVEMLCKEPFIPNTVSLTDEQQLWIITGPNMGGKSTYMRQTALIVLMAHMGSFVPAQSAHIPLVDRIFTRIGATDKVAHGKSTFLVEMEETALICSQATEKSVVILDEVGRGTSTYDGLAIAQAVVEYMYTQVKARCLFATHYHELVALAHHYSGIVAYHAASKQTADGVLLLHKIIPGEAEGSFGIEVARRAQVPGVIVARAQELMKQFNNQSVVPATSTALSNKPSEAGSGSNPVIKIITDIDYDDLSPKQAFDVLWKLKELV